MTIDRARYSERQPLRAADLTADQRYHIAMRRRHQIAHHGWGIVDGLQLEVAPGRIWLRPGVAIDGYGRELIVPEPIALLQHADIFAATGSEAVDIWLIYDRVAETPLVPGRTPGGPGRHTRWRERARVLLRAPPEQDHDPRCPVEVAAADDPCGSPASDAADQHRWPVDLGCAAAPHAPLPDDPARRWPVYLGRVRRSAGGALDVLDVRRPYATLVGELVESPPTRPPRPGTAGATPGAPLLFGQAQLRLGGAGADDPRRLAIGVADDHGAFNERISVDREGNLSTRGHTTVGSDLIDLAALCRALYQSRAIWPFRPEDLKNPGDLAGLLARGEDPLATFIRSRLADATTERLRQYADDGVLREALLDSLALDMNRLLLPVAGYEELLSSVLKPGATWPLAASDLSDATQLLVRLQLHHDTDRHALYLFSGLAATTREALLTWQPADAPPDALVEPLVQDLNRLLAVAELPGRLRLGGPDEPPPPVPVPDGSPRYYAGVRLEPPLPPPAAARPWQIYRSAATEQGQPTNQLRVELLNPTAEGDPPRQLFVIGAWMSGAESKSGAFAPCLSVAADCTVTAHGNLRVEGQVVESPIDADIDDPRFIAMQTAQRSVSAMDVSALAIDFAATPERADPGTTFAYTATLSNTTGTRIADIEVYETLIVAGKTERLNVQIALQPNYFEPQGTEGATATITGSVTAPQITGSTIYIVITAIGVGAAFNIVFASKTWQVAIEPVT